MQTLGDATSVLLAAPRLTVEWIVALNKANVMAVFVVISKLFLKAQALEVRTRLVQKEGLQSFSAGTLHLYFFKKLASLRLELLADNAEEEWLDEVDGCAEHVLAVTFV